MPLARCYAKEIKGMSLRDDYGIPAAGGKEDFCGIVNILDQIHKPVRNFPFGLLPF